MPDLKHSEVERYLQSLLGAPVTLQSMTALGKDNRSTGVKGYGDGTLVKLDFQSSGNQHRTAVLHTISAGPFGHEHMADRAQELLWEHQAFNRLPRHIRSLDVCGMEPDGRLTSAGNIEEFCLLTEYAEGESYSHDLERVRETGNLTEPDLPRADALCDYLVDIHTCRGNDAGLYVRRIRELVGGSECIMGILDSYPDHLLAHPSLLKKIEHLCINWRWRLKAFTQRLSQVHGDFHPWNILFRPGADFSLLDRSRGEYGEPADDVTSLTMNYLFFSLQRSGRLCGAFETLFLRFWDRYLKKSGDGEMLSVAAPFFAFRGLVMASPLWYPTLTEDVRQKLLAFIVAVLESERFDPQKANQYCAV